MNIGDYIKEKLATWSVALPKQHEIQHRNRPYVFEKERERKHCFL